MVRDHGWVSYLQGRNVHLAVMVASTDSNAQITEFIESIFKTDNKEQRKEVG